MTEQAIIISQPSDLRQKLDAIDDRIKEDYEEIVEDVKKAYYTSRLKILQGQWEKGRVVLSAFRGVNPASSFRELERETGRRRGCVPNPGMAFFI
jgi:hypothetical protein